jgi:hypothetical protein
MAFHILHLRIKTPTESADALFTFLKSAIPFYESSGGVRVRLLRRVDDPTRFIEVIEYDSLEAFNKDQHRADNDPQMRAYLQTWRSMLDEGVEVETYEDVTDQVSERR